MLEASLSLLVLGVLAVVTAVLFRRRSVQEQKGAEQLRLAVAEGQTVPLSLHPVIDPTLCVGSFSCIKACPEGEIIGVVDGVATLVEAAHCIGHARCAVECPVGAIKLVFGTAERGVDLPDVDEQFETNRAGVYIIGELGGMGLIKNALRQGLVLGKVLKQRLKKSDAENGGVDVVVVGAGPAGIAAAAALKEQGLTVRVFEQETLGGAVAHYPRGKVVMSEQIVMPNYGAFGRSLLSKEELLEEMRTLVKANRVAVEEGQKVTSIGGTAPRLVVITAQGKRVPCRAVALAIGLRGSPRKLGVDGEDLPKVVYRLIDPEQYHDRNVLVVGGGDSAVEAAIQLAEESTAKVTISYRQAGFGKVKPRNRERITALIDDGRVKALFNTEVSAIEPRHIRLAPAGDKPEKAPASRSSAADKAPRREEHDPGVRGVAPSSAQPPTRPVNASDGDAGDDAVGAFGAQAIPDPLRAAIAALPDRKGPIHDRATVVFDAAAARDALADRKPPGAGDGDVRNARTVVWDSRSGADVREAKAARSASTQKRDLNITGSFRARILDELSGARRRPAPSPAEVEAAATTVPEADDPMPAPATRVREVSARLSSSISRVVGHGRAQSVDGVEAPSAGASASLAAVAGRKETRLRNDDVIVCVGGELPSGFLTAVGVQTRRYQGDERSAFGTRNRPSKAELEEKGRRRLALTLFAVGVSILMGLVLIGREYYWLPLEEREESPLHDLLKPSGLWGHGVGLAATTFMLANFLYALRKRWRPLKGKASIRTWLTFHMFVGIMSPLVIAFHAAFLVNNLLAVWTWIALTVVVGTGIFGRFLFRLVPAQAGKILAVAEIRERVSDMEKVLTPHMQRTKNVAEVTRIFDLAKTQPAEKTVVGAMLREPPARKQLLKSIEGARTHFDDQGEFDLFKESVLKISWAKTQIALYAKLKRVFRLWLVFHVVIAVFMVVLIGLHVAVTTYLGFGDAFRPGA
ncbi:MAG: FAD-binding protein [Deltaproteobacteria bacterium]|nr:FAD-binding protein [Deltaproteobacteria bacterium]